MTKVALILGDYSNGCSDSIQVQVVTNTLTIKQFSNDREFVTKVLSKHLNAAVNELDANEKINPKPKDEPCCEKFKEWAGTLTEMDKEVAFCPYCQTVISPERKKLFIKKGAF